MNEYLGVYDLYGRFHLLTLLVNHEGVDAVIFSISTSIRN